MSEWQKHELGELCTRITVGHVGSMASRYTESGIPFLRSLNIKRGHIDLSSVKYIDEKFHHELAKSQLRPGDLAIVRTGEPGKAALIPDGLGPLNCSDIVIATPRPDVDARFLCYAINETAQDFVKAHTVGAVQQHFNVKSASRLEIHVPKLAHQRAISGLLGALDDKIDVNKLLAKTANELAGALFQGCIERSPRPITDVASITMGQSPPGETYNEQGDGLPFYQGNRDFGMRYPGHRVWCTAVTRYAYENDVLVSVRAPVGEINVATEECGIGRGVAAVRSVRYPHVLLHALSSDRSVWRPYEAEGTVFGSINKKQFSQLNLSWPSEQKIDGLEAQLKTLDNRLRQATEESRALTALRDTLLPQLMSGRLRVKDAEKIVEDHV